MNRAKYCQGISFWYKTSFKLSYKPSMFAHLMAARSSKSVGYCFEAASVDKHCQGFPVKKNMELRVQEKAHTKEKVVHVL